MSPPPSLLSDLARLLGFLLAPPTPTVLTDRERLEVAAQQARLILRRCALGVYRFNPLPASRPGGAHPTTIRRPEPSEN